MVVLPLNARSLDSSKVKIVSYERKMDQIFFSSLDQANDR